MALLIPLAVGCRGASWYAQAIDTSAPSKRQSNSSLFEAADSTEEKTSEEAMAEVLDELEEIGSIDPEAKRELMADLREAKPENWPLIVRQFRSALAFRKQLAEREAEFAEEALAMQEPSTQPRAEVAALQREATAREKSEVMPASLDVQQGSAAKPVHGNDVHEGSSASNQALHLKTSSPSPSSEDEGEGLTTQMLAEPPREVVQQMSYTSHVSRDHVSRDRQELLEAAIADWQAAVNPSPGSTDEVNEHLRLRLLQLLAGDEEAALLPVPGATAAQQDYWSKQLFAVSTFLDSQRQPNDKQRAAGSLMHLDQARAKLAELATLKVRKLAFVDSVEGYGAYEARETTEFRPGDQVTLYAEIDNFSSESTKEGYETILGTSYEVVDKNGKRVDSAQFPEVEDLCKNVRRDFHMQYTVTLPTRIYPEDYELRLIITDQLSHKIGQASVAFKIVE